MTEPSLRIRGLSKSFGGVRALGGVDLTVPMGQVHALLGHNGAGKSTLIKCLGGAFPPDAGTIGVGGRTYTRLSPRESIAAGVAIIFQTLSVVDALTVAENIFLGQEWTRFGRIDRKAQEEVAAGLLERVAARCSPRDRVGDLPMGQRQLVEIAKALSRSASVLVLDEPTAALSGAESDALAERVEDLRAQGLAIVYVTHLLSEVERLADAVTVLRDGRVAHHAPMTGQTRRELVRAIVGRAVGDEAGAEGSAPAREHGRGVHAGSADATPRAPDGTAPNEPGEVAGVGTPSDGPTEAPGDGPAVEQAKPDADRALNAAVSGADGEGVAGTVEAIVDDAAGEAAEPDGLGARDRTGGDTEDEGPAATVGATATDGGRPPAEQVVSVAARTPRRPDAPPAPPRLTVDGLCGPGFGPVSFAVAEGERVGLYGLMGSGRTRLLETLFGGRRATGGAVRVGERAVVITRPAQALAAGIALVPGDRRRQGLFPTLSAQDNALLPAVRPLARNGVRALGAERRVFEAVADAMGLRPARPKLAAGAFSGGNQQKLVLARWINGVHGVDVLLLDEPSQGVDVGARQEIHQVVSSLAAERKAAVLFASSDPEEIVALADRCLVVAGGRIVGELSGARLTEQALLSAVHQAGTDPVPPVSPSPVQGAA
ncbi:sugar ABC transporter ATP-binding protein [Streptomyces spongiae]|uniref:ATP-binding cassette domain-containing protein n=1 Tax=Streptomyces spongiae TaxID=565072 RepID=A0A5N8XEC8_9ACTN|nr:sugar ABC transporter ATP-binding protein [Streptomyces spongiae]MPY57873.1 ATP-binding cassette domain-containing protein [Streptomyces spongiae]